MKKQLYTVRPDTTEEVLHQLFGVPLVILQEHSSNVGSAIVSISRLDGKPFLGSMGMPTHQFWITRNQLQPYTQLDLI